MTNVEAMEFLLGKLGHTKSNREFFNIAIGDGSEKILNICAYPGWTSFLEADTENQQEAADLDTVMTVDVEEKSEVVMEDLEYQKAPLVGTFYLSSKPGEPSFVSIGDTVSKGQTI